MRNCISNKRVNTLNFIIEKTKRFVIHANNRQEALDLAKQHDDRNSCAYYEVIGVLDDRKSGEAFDER